jgi:hypothetical protein
MKRKVVVCFSSFGFILGVFGFAYGLSTYLSQFKTTYPAAAMTIGASCTLCHTGSPSITNINPYAQAFANAGHNFATIEPLDSDGDGFTNIQEINAGTYPGDATSKPATAVDASPPTVTAFSIPATSTMLMISINTFTATDNVGVTGYMVTESATAPAAGAAGWSATAPTGYTCTTAGAKTLYAWAKDGANNVSTSMSATVTITLVVVDTTPPTVSTFAIPATSTSLTVPINTFTATDNVGVTAYMVTESSTAPLATATGWSAAAPTTYTFTTAGAKTLYAWAKDGANNVSTSRSSSTTIALDVVPPMITNFTIPAAGLTLTVPITTFTATDNVGITGYLLTETSTVPAATAAGWSATAPATYTFSSSGTKTLYAWAKDGANNVSTSMSATVVITIVATTPPTNLTPADKATAVSCTSKLQITASFPNPSGNGQKSTDWEVSTDPAFGVGAMVFKSIGDALNLATITIPTGVLQQNSTYYWRARTTDSAGQISDMSAGTAFTTQSIAMDATGVVPASMEVKQGSKQVMSMGGLTTADLAAIGNVSPKLMADFPAVNAGAATDLTKAGMMVLKANGGASNDILGIVTPAGTQIMEITTAATSDPGFNNAALPGGMSLPYGAVGFRIADVNPGQPVTVTIYAPSDLPAGAVWYKYNPAKGWLRVDATGTHDANGALLSASTKFVVTAGKGMLTILDDDAFADYSTEIVAGKAVIVDPGAVGVPAAGGADVGGGGGGSGCFIATAAFGSYFDPYVKILRDFRDIFLLTNSAGKAFVDFYYRTSPPVAQFIAKNEFLKGAVRIGLMPVVGFSALSLQVGVFWTLMLVIAMLGVFIMVLRSIRRYN